MAFNLCVVLNEDSAVDISFLPCKAQTLPNWKIQAVHLTVNACILVNDWTGGAISISHDLFLAVQFVLVCVCLLF